MKFLYVDDSAFDRMAFKRVLKKYPEVDFEVYESFRELNPVTLKKENCVLIRDCYLPGSDELEFNFDGEIFFVSGGRLSDKLRKDLEIGEGRFFQKPLKPENIDEILNQLKGTNVPVNVDLEYIKELSDGDEGFEKEMIEVYMNEVPVQLEEVREHFQKKDFKGIAEKVHALRTKIRTFGLEEVDELANYLELEARKEEVSNTVDFNKKLRILISSIEQSVEEMGRLA